MKKIAWQMDNSICGLLKTLKSDYVHDLIDKGSLYFNYPSFYENSELMPAQKDKYDSWKDYDASHLLIAPIIEEHENNITYGKPIELSSHAEVHIISEANKHRPICCFRAVKEEDFVEKNNALFFSLGDIADRIKSEFGHDAFVYFFNPRELQHRLNTHALFYGHEIFYGIHNMEFQHFINNSKLKQCEMFQKDECYSWQKEYRIVLDPREGKEGFIISLGSLADIAIAGRIDDLRDGGIVIYEQEK